MYSESAKLKQINPSTKSNSIQGNTQALGLSDFNIKVDNSTVDLTLVITYKGGNTDTFTFNYDFILDIVNSEIQSLTFTDTNDYLISITQNFKTFENEDEFNIFKNIGSMRFIR